MDKGPEKRLRSNCCKEVHLCAPVGVDSWKRRRRKDYFKISDLGFEERMGRGTQKAVTERNIPQANQSTNILSWWCVDYSHEWNLHFSRFQGYIKSTSVAHDKAQIIQIKLKEAYTHCLLITPHWSK